MPLPAAPLAGWLVVALVNAVMIAILPLPADGWGVRIAQHLYDLGHCLALGFVSRLAVVTWQRWFAGSLRAALVATYCAALAVGLLVLFQDVSVLAGRIAPVGPVVMWQVLIVAAMALALPVTVFCARLLSRSGLRWIGLAICVGIAALNHRVLLNDYPGVHFFAAWIAAVLCAGCLTSWVGEVRVPWPVDAALALGASASLVYLPPSGVLLQLYQSPGSVLAPFVMRWRSFQHAGDATVAGHDPWLQPRADAPDVPPTEPRSGVPGDPFVILLTVDCLRADLVMQASDDLPTFARLRRESVTFANARTVAPATNQAITALFSSRYYSQQYWVHDTKLHRKYHYPHEDPSPRLPDVLRRGGVRTVSIQGLPGIVAATGLAPGFEEETVVPGPPRDFAGVREMMPKVIARALQNESGPRFLYAHFADPHAPYNRGGDHGSAYDDYVAEVALVDRGIGELLDALEREELLDRTVLIVSADHGEAFGEHRTEAHATIVYDEVLRIPLLVRMPGVAPRVVEEPVSLVDIGTTVIDLFGLPAPGVFMGQSLLPLVLDRPAALTRPVAFESSRGQRGVVFPDGLKVIEDFRRGTVEIYDLTTDPSELTNRYDPGSSVAQERLAYVRALFAANRYEREGYELPFAR